MADGKENNLDSINQVDEEESLQKANAQESLRDPVVQEEHFKQNIMMEVDEFPNNDNTAQEVVDEQLQIKESEILSKEEIISESHNNIIIDESAIYVNDENVDEDKSLSSQSNLLGVKNDSADQAREAGKQSSAAQAVNDQAPEGIVDNNAFQSLGVDQEIEEAILFSPDNEGRDPVGNSNTAPEVFDSNVTADEDNVLNGQLFAQDDDVNDTLIDSVISQPESGSVIVNDDGSYSFIPGDDFQSLGIGESQEVTFTYQVQDEGGATDTPEIIITVVRML